ncbi:MAG: restriction endonuclease subunit S [Burkholderiaceae bacterium]|nr:restriction endonuclease subunit S [Burkholderiaceae bacterium]
MDSGVEWLGELPGHWQVRQARRLFEQRRDNALPEDEQLSATQKYGVIPQRLFMEQEDQKVVLALSGLDNFKHLEPDDFVISLRSFQGGIERSRYGGCVSPAYTVLRPMPGLVARYWEYLLKCTPYIAALQTTTDGIRDGKNISYGQFGGLCVPLAPENEQTAIGAFLDNEIGKIDTLIAEQEKLIPLLAEKRQATISQAVTRGLNPAAPTKDTGLAWLGKMPAHWNMTRLKYATSLIADCPHETPVYDEEGTYKVVRTADITEGQLHANDMYCVNEVEYQKRIRRHALRKDDLVYGREGERWGFAAQVPEDEKFCLGQRMMQFRSTDTMHPRYLMWQLNSLSTYRQGQIDTVGAAAPHVNVGTIRNYYLAEPPLKEQKEIFAFLDSESTKLDVLTTEAKRVIALLKERRSALIAAAVTGQIDVRGAVARPAATMEAMAA